ncbi:hypothetical protein CH254_15775 [Rhodococcus sp. 06-412-2C]|nr:hypothetical protein CH254_15775 [Rhodococcus sp. 06-412-2C]OZD00585.1 hypothetical protein CH279_06140 [Rhodococcus sp. 06-412-2B]
MNAGSLLSTRTRERSDTTGVSVFDVEVFTLDGTRGRNEWMPVLAAGSDLGAQVLNVIGGDDDHGRFLDSLTNLVLDAADFGITASIEPISYQKIDTFRSAAAVSRQTGCGIMLDVLHFVRAGGHIDDLSVAPVGAVRVIQLCDGPLEVPDIPAPRKMPLGQDTNGSARQIESRAKRLVPGDGTFPLGDILAALPGVPVSVEVPDVEYIERKSAAMHLERLFAATQTLVAASDHHRTDA